MLHEQARSTKTFQGENIHSMNYVGYKYRFCAIILNECFVNVTGRMFASSTSHNPGLCVCVCVFLCSFVCAPPVEPLHVLFPFQNNDGVITAGQSGSSSEAAETSNKPGSLLEQIHAFGCPTSGMHVEKQVCMQFYSCVACRDPPMKEASVTYETSADGTHLSLNSSIALGKCFPFLSVPDLTSQILGLLTLSQ